MNTLVQYLKANNLTQTDFAARLNVHQGTVSKLCAGRQPSLQLALKIERVTGGKVRPSDWSSSATARAAA